MSGKSSVITKRVWLHTYTASCAFIHSFAFIAVSFPSLAFCSWPQASPRTLVLVLWDHCSALIHRTLLLVLRETLLPHPRWDPLPCVCLMTVQSRNIGHYAAVLLQGFIVILIMDGRIGKMRLGWEITTIWGMGRFRLFLWSICRGAVVPSYSALLANHCL
jgi:hypothetical protein